MKLFIIILYVKKNAQKKPRYFKKEKQRVFKICNLLLKSIDYKIDDDKNQNFKTQLSTNKKRSKRTHTSENKKTIFPKYFV